MTDSQKRPAIDWEAIQREFRAGQLSVCEIARQHGITDAAIRKKAKQHGWARDLGDRVRQETRAKLAREDIRLVGSGPSSGSGSGSTREDEARTIELAAERGVAIVRDHRVLLRRSRDLALRMLDELEATTTHEGQLAAMIEADTAGDQSPQRRNTMMRAIETPGRIAALKDLSMLAKNLLPLERQAFNLDAEVKEASDTLGDLVEAARKLPPVTS